jgi:hypothetical protein
LDHTDLDQLILSDTQEFLVRIRATEGFGTTEGLAMDLSVVGAGVSRVVETERRGGEVRCDLTVRTHEHISSEDIESFLSTLPFVRFCRVTRERTASHVRNR